MPYELLSNESKKKIDALCNLFNLLNDYFSDSSGRIKSNSLVAFLNDAFKEEKIKITFIQTDKILADRVILKRDKEPFQYYILNSTHGSSKYKQYAFAHELGHVVLSHFLRKDISDIVMELEAEADYFANRLTGLSFSYDDIKSEMNLRLTLKHLLIALGDICMPEYKAKKIICDYENKKKNLMINKNKLRQ